MKKTITEEKIYKTGWDDCQRNMDENKEQQLFEVGYHKGEMDFGVNALVSDLTYEQMKELREMTVVAIGQMEAMWARGQEAKREKPLTNQLPA